MYSKFTIELKIVKIIDFFLHIVNQKGLINIATKRRIKRLPNEGILMRERIKNVFIEEANHDFYYKRN